MVIGRVRAGISNGLWQRGVLGAGCHSPRRVLCTSNIASGRTRLSVFGMLPEDELTVRQLTIPVHADGGIAADLLIHGKPLVVPNLDTVSDRITPAVLPLLRHMGIFSFVAVPLRSNGSSAT